MRSPIVGCAPRRNRPHAPFHQSIVDQDVEYRPQSLPHGIGLVASRVLAQRLEF